MVFGPCGGVRPDRSCEAGGRPCPFAESAAAVPWDGDVVAGAERGVIDPARPDPLILTDLTVRPFDRRSVEEITSILAGTADAVLVGEHQARPDFPPTLMVDLVRQAGGEAIVTLTCRDRNRVVLEQELAGLVDVDVSGVLCVTGDLRAPGVRADVTQVFDLDGTRLANLAAGLGLPVLVPESPGAPPAGARPDRLRQKERAGAGLCVLNHAGPPASVRRFVEACRAAGVTLPFVAAVPVFTDARSAAVLDAFPGLELPTHQVDAVLSAGDPVAAGIDAAVAEASELLAIDGVVGVNLSGLASSDSLEAGARIKAEVGAAVREVRR
jgi:5,10-methylenetetrahydrofolate reductase